MRSAGGEARRLVAVGGGTKGGLWTQIVSDVLGRAQVMPTVTIGACYGVTYSAAVGTPVYAERIKAGWYQLPGDTPYYGADRTTTGGAIALGSSEVDNACGTIGKAVYDAAHIADPEIDYSDYDTDKDGVVDFFMMVFVGLGGNGDSLVNGREREEGQRRIAVMFRVVRHLPHQKADGQDGERRARVR